MLALGALAFMHSAARADVTTHESMSLDAAGIVKIHGTTVERTSADRQRKDSEFHCEGFMSLLCGNTKSGDIIRIDRALEWQLRPDKKSYLETPFPTAEERAAAQKKIQETLDKMKQCPQQPPQQASPAAADTSKCDLSPPKIEVKQSDEHASLAGHDTRKSSVSLLQTCTDKQTGDVCEMVYGFDVWLTGDEIAGVADRLAFQRAYMKKLGLDENNAATKGAAQQFLAQYAGTMKTLSAKASDLKGYPLRTTFRFSIGGAHCGKAKQSSSQNVDTSQGSGDLEGLAAKAGSKLLGGLLSKKSSSSTPDPNQPPAAAPGAAPSTQLIAFTVETTAIDTAAIAAEQFELPAGWTPEKPKASRSEDFSCPTHGK